MLQEEGRFSLTDPVSKFLPEFNDVKGRPYLNPVRMMADSKARGSVDNFRRIIDGKAIAAELRGEHPDAATAEMEFFSETLAPARA